MKNTLKVGALALVVSFAFASCNNAAKTGSSADSTAASAKVDSTAAAASTKVDSSKKDSAKSVDSAKKKDTTKKGKM